MASAIYKISSISKPDRFYIGSAVVYSRRAIRHRSELNTGKHPNKKMQNHFTKYGIADFKIEIVEVVEDKNNLIKREQYYIDTLRPYFNLSPTAGNAIGVKHSQESREKRRVQRLGFRFSEESIKKMCSSQKGNKNNLGKPHSADAKLKIGTASSLRNQSVNNPAYKGIVQAFKDNLLIGEFLGASECSERLGVNAGCISSCLKGRRKTAGGYTFKRIANETTVHHD